MPPPSGLGQLEHSFPDVVTAAEDKEGDFACKEGGREGR